MRRPPDLIPPVRPVRRVRNGNGDGRSPGLRIFARALPSRLPSGMDCGARSPLTVAGAAGDLAATSEKLPTRARTPFPIEPRRAPSPGPRLSQVRDAAQAQAPGSDFRRGPKEEEPRAANPRLPASRKPALDRAAAELFAQNPMSPMPPMPPGGMAGPADFCSGFSATMASVVIKRPAIEAASCSAMRTTLVGSMMPALNMSP